MVKEFVNHQESRKPRSRCIASIPRRRKERTRQNLTKLHHKLRMLDWCRNRQWTSYVLVGHRCGKREIVFRSLSRSCSRSRSANCLASSKRSSSEWVLTAGPLRRRRLFGAEGGGATTARTSLSGVCRLQHHWLHLDIKGRPGVLQLSLGTG